MYVRLHLSDGTWIKIKVTDKHPDYAVMKCDGVNLSHTSPTKATPRNSPSIQNEPDAKMRASFKAAIEIEERQRTQCIQIIQQQKMILVKLARIRQKLDSCQLQYDSGNSCQYKLHDDAI